MLYFYNVYYSTYHNGTFIGKYKSYTCQEEVPQDEEVVITWDNLDEMYEKYDLVLKFNIWKFKKKGRVVSFFHPYMINVPKDFRDIYEKTAKNLNITLTIQYQKDNPPIKRVLEYHNGERAIQYLTERGLIVNR